MNLRARLERLLARVRVLPIDWLTLRLMRRLPLPPRRSPKAATTRPVTDDDKKAM